MDADGKESMPKGWNAGKLTTMPRKKKGEKMKKRKKEEKLTNGFVCVETVSALSGREGCKSDWLKDMFGSGNLEVKNNIYLKNM